MIRFFSAAVSNAANSSLVTGVAAIGSVLLAPAFIGSAVIGSGLVLAAPSANAADAGAGKALFREQCSVCHSAEAGDNGGAQGPSLNGVFGGHSANSAGFPYTSALRSANLTWNSATLKRFLAAPAALVPGTAMGVSVPSEADRDNLIAYFQNLPHQTAAQSPADIPAATESSADWKHDAPGKVHRISVAALPPPFATASTRNNPSLAPRPATAKLAVPDGFRVEPFYSELRAPRKMLLADNGDVLVSETAAGRISVLHPSSDNSRVTRAVTYVDGLKQPFGLAFYPNAADPQWLYVAETNRVIRYPYRNGDVKPRGEPQIVVPQLPSGGGHITRDIAFSPDGSRLFVSVGSGSNIADSMPKKSPDEIKAWEAEHGLGAAWGPEADRAAVLVFDAKTPGAAKTYATGIRNCVSLTVQPANGALWCTTNERDLLGDDLVPDYSARIVEGAYYGWPWYYMGSNEDPRLKGDRPDLKGKAAVPEVPYQAHSASLNLTFYTTSGGKSAFPTDYVGDAFAAFHGSWNRSLRTGYKLVRVHMKNNQPTGDYEDFLTGFVIDNGDVWGRPVATVELKDGSLLMSEDGGHMIYRISYVRH